MLRTRPSVSEPYFGKGADLSFSRFHSDVFSVENLQEARTLVHQCQLRHALWHDGELTQVACIAGLIFICRGGVGGVKERSSFLRHRATK